MVENPKSKKPSTAQELKLEIQKLNATLQEVRDELEDLRPPNAWRRTWRNFASGVVKGLGFLIGSTIIAGLVAFGVYRLVDSDAFRSWIGDIIAGAVEEQIESVIPEIF